MKAYVLHEYGDINKLQLEDIPKPQPLPDEVVIKIMATGINPVDITAIAGDMSHAISLPAVLGTDVSGIIEAIGTNVKDFTVGEAVMGMINYPGSDGAANGHGYGAYAQTPASQIIKKTANITFEQAAALPAVGLTAMQVIKNIGAVKAGQRILVHGGAGGVGHLIIQIAKMQGAYVYATANNSNWKM